MSILGGLHPYRQLVSLVPVLTHYHTHTERAQRDDMHTHTHAPLKGPKRLVLFRAFDVTLVSFNLFLRVYFT